MIYPGSNSLDNPWSPHEYTPGAAPRLALPGAIKQRLRNAHWSHLFGTPVLPRLGMPRWVSPVFGLLKPWVAESFGLRHLAIPDAKWLIGCLRSEGFRCSQSLSCDVVTVIESERIARRAFDATPFDVRAGKKIARAIATPLMDKQDVVQIVCTREWP